MKPTLAVYAGPGAGEQLYRRVAEAFGFPDGQVLWSAVRTATLDGIDTEVFPELRFDLLEDAGTGRRYCMVQGGQDGKLRGAIVFCDGAAMVMLRAFDQRKFDELFLELAQILASLPGDIRLRVIGMPRARVCDTTAAELSAGLVGVVDVTRNGTHPEGEAAQPGGL